MNTPDSTREEGQAALFDHLLWMDDPVPRGAALNMAIDEALLTGFATMGSAARPILRVYRWSEPSGSLGYFEPLDPARNALPGRALVRRWTGGGLVSHGDDLTYSLLVPRALIPNGWRADAAYNRIHEALAAALQTAGLSQVVLSHGAGASLAAAGAEVTSRECFVSPVRYDILLDGRKIAGAAQRRTRHGLLHQGSVQMPAGTAAGSARFDPGTKLHSAVCAALPAALARRVATRRITDQELDSSERLAATRYGVPEWTEKF